MADILSVLIWFETVCLGYQQITKGGDLEEELELFVLNYNKKLKACKFNVTIFLYIGNTEEILKAFVDCIL